MKTIRKLPKKLSDNWKWNSYLKIKRLFRIFFFFFINTRIVWNKIKEILLITLNFILFSIRIFLHHSTFLWTYFFFFNYFFYSFFLPVIIRMLGFYFFIKMLYPHIAFSIFISSRILVHCQWKKSKFIFTSNGKNKPEYKTFGKISSVYIFINILFL